MDRTPAFGAPARILPRDDWTRVPAAPELGAVLHTLDELNAPDYEAEDELEDATRVPPQRTFATLRAIGRSALPVGTLLAYAGDYAVLLVRLEPTGVHGYGVRLLEVRTPGVLGARRSVVALVTHMRLHARLTIAVTESRVELAEYNALHTLLLELGLHPPGAGTPAQELEWAVDALENAAAIADVHENSLHQLSDADARDLVSTYERTGTGEPELARLAFALLPEDDVGELAERASASSPPSSSSAVVERDSGVFEDDGDGEDCARAFVRLGAEIAGILDGFVRTNVRYDRTLPDEYAAALDAILAALGHEKLSLDDVKYVLRTQRALMLHPALNAPVLVPRECMDTPEMEEHAAGEQPAELESELSAVAWQEARHDVSDFERAWLELETELATAIEYVRTALGRDVRTRTYLHSSLPEEGMFFSSFTLRCPRRIHQLLIENLILMYTEERAKRENTPFLWTERPLYVGAREEQLLTLAFRHIHDPYNGICCTPVFAEDAGDAEDEPPPLEQCTPPPPAASSPHATPGTPPLTPALDLH